MKSVTKFMIIAVVVASCNGGVCTYDETQAADTTATQVRMTATVPETEGALPLSVKDSEKITSNDTDYMDMMLTGTNSDTTLSSLFANMTKQPGSKLIPLSGRVAKAPSTVQQGYPLSYVRAIDENSAVKQELPDGKVFIATSEALLIRKKEALKVFETKPVAYIYNPKDGSVGRMNSEKAVLARDYSSPDEIEKIPLTAVAADSREHMLVVYLNDKAKVVPVKAKKHYFVRDYAEQIKPL